MISEQMCLKVFLCKFLAKWFLSLSLSLLSLVKRCLRYSHTKYKYRNTKDKLKKYKIKRPIISLSLFLSLSLPLSLPLSLSTV